MKNTDELPICIMIYNLMGFTSVAPTLKCYICIYVDFTALLLEKNLNRITDVRKLAEYLTHHT